MKLINLSCPEHDVKLLKLYCVPVGELGNFSIPKLSGTHVVALNPRKGCEQA